MPKTFKVTIEKTFVLEVFVEADSAQGSVEEIQKHFSQESDAGEYCGSTKVHIESTYHKDQSFEVKKVEVEKTLGASFSKLETS